MLFIYIGLKSSKETVATGATSSSGSGQPKSMVTPSAIAQSKHPVSALQEISQKRHWSIPRYEMATPTDGMPFLFKVAPGRTCVCVLYHKLCRISNTTFF